MDYIYPDEKIRLFYNSMVNFYIVNGIMGISNLTPKPPGTFPCSMRNTNNERSEKECRCKYWCTAQAGIPIRCRDERSKPPRQVETLFCPRVLDGFVACFRS
jgi:hypothetical protein